MRYGTIVALLAALFTVATPASAVGEVAVRKGDMLRDANQVRLGAVNTVNKDGSVGIIYNSRYVTLPVSTLSVVEGKLITSLSKAEISAR